ncbi:MAG: porin [Aliishimia sp.]
MRNYGLAAAVILSAAATQAVAQDSGFEWEGELEIGVDTTLDSETPGNEFSDTYAIVTLEASLALGQQGFVFGTLVGESVTDATDDRAFEDFGLYIEELGVGFNFGNSTVRIGKTAPTFGRTWDDGAGYFNDIVAEDYEQTEQIGVFVDTEIVPSGVLSFGVYYADDTALSRSIGEDRGRTRVSDGGAGNTGNLDNVALSWTQEFGDTSIQVGARHLSAGEGDLSDETGFVASAGHSFGNGLDVFAELASFDGFGGAGTDVTYATITGAYAVGDYAFSAGLAVRDDAAAGETNVVSLGVDYEFANGIALGSGLAFVDDAGTDETLFGVSVVVPFGG